MIRRPSPTRAAGFTLLEVMVALAILSVSLVAIIGINGGTVSAHAYAKQVSVATMLARSKLVDLESQFIQEGFTSEFDQKLNGDFSEEGWPGIKWEAEIVKPDLDAANANGMVQDLIQNYLGDAEESATQARRESTSASAPTTDPKSQLASIQPMIEAQVTTLTETLEKAVREVRLTVTWKDGANEESLEVVTHMVVLAPAGQPGGEYLDPELAAQAMATESTIGTGNPGTGNLGTGNLGTGSTGLGNTGLGTQNAASPTNPLGGGLLPSRPNRSRR